MSQNSIWAGAPLFGTGAPSGNPPNNGANSPNVMYFDTSTSPFTGYVFKTGAWHQVGQGATPANRAASTSHPADPTAPSSTAAFKMQGLAGTITPALTGKVLVTICGNLIGSTVTDGDGILIQASHGTGAAPANDAALAGTQDGAAVEYTNPATVTAADIHVPFSITVLLSGLTVGTPYWLDIAAKSAATASSVGLANVNITAVEVG